VGEFAPQQGLKRIAWPAPPPALMRRGVTLFTDRDYVLDEMPDAVRDLPFLRTSIEKTDVTVTRPGTLFALTPTVRPEAASQEAALAAAGFDRVDVPGAQLFPGEVNRVCLWRKAVQAGERLRFRKGRRRAGAGTRPARAGGDRRPRSGVLAGPVFLRPRQMAIAERDRFAYR
jgi:hypothetical protein